MEKWMNLHLRLSFLKHCKRDLCQTYWAIFKNVKLWKSAIFFFFGLFWHIVKQTFAKLVETFSKIVKVFSRLYVSSIAQNLCWVILKIVGPETERFCQFLASEIFKQVQHYFWSKKLMLWVSLCAQKLTNFVSFCS